MLLRSLVLKNFRNYSSLNIHFSQGVNLIVGDNGIGKTNLLEAIHLLSTGKSFKTNQLQDLIKEGEQYFFVQADFVKDGVNQILKIGYNKTKKVVEYNTTKLQALSHILGILPSTFYCPKDLAIVMGTPSDRRRFLNILLAQSDPLYVRQFFRYTKALKQRNVLLKLKKLSGIEYFEHEMVSSGLYLAEQRKKALKNLETALDTFVHKLTQHSESYHLRYSSLLNIDKEDKKAFFIHQLNKNKPKELALSTTLTGPHRDDIGIFQNKKMVKLFSSEGQKRTFIAALKCAEWDLMHNNKGYKPLFCIDDFGEHLDEKRKVRLEQLLPHFGQVFITMPKNTLKRSPEKVLDIQQRLLNIV